MKVGIVGTRDKRHDLLWPIVNREISALSKDTIIATGCNKHGVDWLVREIATELGYQLVVFHARWGALDKAAGPERNGNLVAYVDRAIAIFGPHSVGTWDVVRKMKKLKKPCKEVKAELPE